MLVLLRSVKRVDLTDIVENSKHGHNAIGVAVGTRDIATSSPDIVNVESDSTGTLGDHSASFQSVINPVN